MWDLCIYSINNDHYAVLKHFGTEAHPLFVRYTWEQRTEEMWGWNRVSVYNYFIPHLHTRRCIVYFCSCICSRNTWYIFYTTTNAQSSEHSPRRKEELSSRQVWESSTCLSKVLLTLKDTKKARDSKLFCRRAFQCREPILLFYVVVTHER